MLSDLPLQRRVLAFLNSRLGDLTSIVSADFPESEFNREEILFVKKCTNLISKSGYDGFLLSGNDDVEKLCDLVEYFHSLDAKISESILGLFLFCQMVQAPAGGGSYASGLANAEVYSRVDEGLRAQIVENMILATFCFPKNNVQDPESYLKEQSVHLMQLVASLHSGKPSIL